MTKKENGVTRRLFFLIYPYRLKVLMVCILLILYTVTSLLMPILNKNIIDEGILKKNLSTVVLLISVIIILAGINFVIDIYKEKIRSEISYDLGISLYLKAFESLINAKMCFFNFKNETEIYNDIQFDISRIQEICSPNIFSAVIMLFGFVGGLVGLFIIEWRLAIVAIVFIPIKIIVIKYLSREKKIFHYKLTDSSNMLGKWFGDNIAGVKEIKLFCIKGKKVQELKEKVGYFQYLLKKISILDRFNVATEIFLMKVVESAITVSGAYLIYKSDLTLGSLFAFLTYAIQVISPVSMLLNIKYQFSGIIPSAKRYFELLDRIEENKEICGQNEVAGFEVLEFSNVKFSYGEKKIIENASFIVKKCDKVALIGPNGAGKSTIFNLIEQFITPENGFIYLNNKQLDTYDTGSWRNLILAINQDSYLFDASIVDNLNLAEEFDLQTIDSALRRVGLTDDMKISGSNIGTDGKKLSAGQRQKVMLARNILYNREIYLLDEAVSNLDTFSENLIFDLFKKELKNKTVIMITHNIRSIKFFDKIIQIKPTGNVVFYENSKDFNSDI